MNHKDPQAIRVSGFFMSTIGLPETNKTGTPERVNGLRAGVRKATLFIYIIIFLNIITPRISLADTASWYSIESCKKEGTSGICANGKELNDEAFTCASWDYKFGTRLKVTNLHNKKSVSVVVTDRGPARRLYMLGRKVDLSRAAFSAIAELKQGIIPVKITVTYNFWKIIGIIGISLYAIFCLALAGVLMYDWWINEERQRGRDKMCRFFSGIITKNKTIWDYDNDSHEYLIKKGALKDTTMSPDFVRVELLPIDGDIFNHNMKNWKIQVDQDFKPDWFTEEWAEHEMKGALKKVIDERFIINKTIGTIDKGRYFIGHNGIVENVRNNGIVENVRGNGIVKNVWGNGIVENVRNNGIVKYVWDNGIVENVRDNGIVEDVWDNGIVKNVWDNGIVKDVWDNGIVENVRNNGIVEYVGGNGIVKYVWDNGIVKNVWGNGIVILRKKINPEIVVANPKIKMIKFKKDK